MSASQRALYIQWSAHRIPKLTIIVLEIYYRVNVTERQHMFIDFYQWIKWLRVSTT